MAQFTCSLCGGNMVRGKAVIKRGYPIWLSRFPWVSDRLAFYPDDEDIRTETVLQESRRVESYHCGQCGSLLMTPNKWSPPG